jgi:hypothetical protein
LEINVLDDKKIVEIWLTRAEQEDPALNASLKDIYAEYKQKKYTVAVFKSGDRDLYQSTLDLLSYNKKRVAEIAVQREKRQRAAMER